MPRIHQLLPTFTPADAMGQVAMAWQRVLRHLGSSGSIYAQEVAPAWQSVVCPLDELTVEPDDLVLYHHGIASSLSGKLLHLKCRRGLVFHNITPARFYEGTRLAEPLRAGRAQLAAMAGLVDVSIAVSAFNARELEEAGHRDVHVVPLFVETSRFSDAFADEELLAKLSRSGRPRVVSVSRVVPHKRMEDLLSLHEELRRIAPQAELWIVGGYAPGQASFKALSRRAKALGGVRFLGRLTHARLVAAYRAADVFVSMSEHEGFGLPLIEAMAAEIPVLAYGAAAISETMDGRGVVFDQKHFAGLAELVKELVGNQALRQKIVVGQNKRVEALSFEQTRDALARAVALPHRGRPRRQPKRRIGIVVQRFGQDITGGAEAHARMVAQRLAKHGTVEVFSTCAKDHLTWANEFKPGTTQDGSLRVHRFLVRKPRQMRTFNRLSDVTLDRPQDFATETHWIAEQGPNAPKLIDALSDRAMDFDAFIFFTYLYAPTVWGVPLVAAKALVVPTTHDEPPLRFEAMRDVFECPRALLTNTPEESQLVLEHFPNAARQRVVGVGVEPPPSRAHEFQRRFGIESPFLLYLGRLEPGKGINELIERHEALARRYHDTPTLAFAGSGPIVPSGRRIKYLGRIDERAKWDALREAMAVVVPSRFESLSLVTLEAFAVGTPVIGNEDCAVVAGQIARSGGGLACSFEDNESYSRAVQTVGESREAYGKRALRYAGRHSWERVVDAYLEEIDALGSPNTRRPR